MQQHKLNIVLCGTGTVGGTLLQQIANQQQSLFRERDILLNVVGIVDIFNIMRNKKIEPKKIKFVFPNKNKKTNLILIKGVKKAKPFLEYENNLYVYNEEGNYTDDILKIYNKK